MSHFPRLGWYFNTISKVNPVVLTTGRRRGPWSLPKSQVTHSSVKAVDVFSKIKERLEDLEKRPTGAVTKLATAGQPSPSWLISPILSGNPQVPLWTTLAVLVEIFTHCHLYNLGATRTLRMP